jgi:hypothetical protein
MSTIAHEPSREAPERRRRPSQLLVRDSTTVPSAVVVALFALLGTRVVAKYGFGHRDPD